MLGGILGDVPRQATASFDDMFEFHRLLRREVLAVADRLDGGLKFRGRAGEPSQAQIRAARDALYARAPATRSQLEMAL